MSEAQNIQWFPGHMAKTRRQIKAVMPLIDAVAEVVDARIPVSSRNPELKSLTAGKPIIVLLNKCDMADPKATEEWIRYYKAKGISAIGIDCKSGKGINQFKDTVKTALADRLNYYAEKGMVGKPQGIVFRHADKAAFVRQIFANVLEFKAGVIIRNGIRAVITGGLNKGKERLFLRLLFFV